VGGFRRIIVSSDGSPSALDALALALRLRDPDGGALILACVVPSHPWHLPGAGGDDTAVRDAQEMLGEVQAGLPAGIPVLERTPKATSAARGLTELAEAEGADLVTIGSAAGAVDGRIGIARTAGRLLHGAPCAVAIAPPGERETVPFRHVGVALDSSPEAAHALGIAYGIASTAGSAMTLYAAIDQTTELPGGVDVRRARLAVQDRLDAAADSAPAGVNPRTMLLVGSPGPVIAEACDGIVDLLVAGSRGYGSLQRALLGSVSEELIARSTHPVLIVPRPPRAGGSATAAAEAVETA
jgi:nucleotide-binding universal stress UspA family protein